MAKGRMNLFERRSLAVTIVGAFFLVMGALELIFVYPCGVNALQGGLAGYCLSSGLDTSGMFLLGLGGVLLSIGAYNYAKGPIDQATI